MGIEDPLLLFYWRYNLIYNVTACLPYSSRPQQELVHIHVYSIVSNI
jgi:hypothetical protein